MPTFTTLSLLPDIPAGVHLGKIVKATERISERGNPMIVMTIELPPPDRQRLPCTITFVPAARALVNAFCSSAGLIKPSEPNISVEPTARHCLNRYLYFRLEHDEDGAPKDHPLHNSGSAAAPQSAARRNRPSAAGAACAAGSAQTITP